LVIGVETVGALDSLQGGGCAVEGELEAEAFFAAAVLPGDLLEASGDDFTLLGELGQALEDGGRGLLPGGHGAADLSHGIGDLLGVLGIELDGFVIEVERVFLKERLDGVESFGRDADELAKLEDSGAVKLPQADDAIGLSAADVQVLRAELLPGGRTTQLDAALADAQEGFGLGCRTAASHDGEGLVLSQNLS